MMTLVQFSNSIITVNEIDSFYNEEYSFDLDIDKSLQIAFGITYYDGNEERLDFGDVGEIVPRLKSWNDTTGVLYTDLRYRDCTKEELGIDEPYQEDKAHFHPPHRNSVGLFKKYWKKLSCIDDPVEIHGDYNSVHASHL